MTNLPSTFIAHLEQRIPGFDRETQKLAVAQMTWMTVDPLREHKYYKNAFSFTTDDIKALFGDVATFKKVNRDPLTRYFRVHRWRNGSNKEHSFTNGYELMPWMSEALEEFLEEPPPSQLLNKNGQAFRIAPNGIASLDKDGNPVTGWARCDAPSLVEVDVQSIKQAHLDCELLLAASQQGLLPDTVSYDGDGKTKQIIRSAKVLRALAANSTFPRCIMHQYVQSASGRLYAGGLNLQSCPRALRHAALVGHWDYDIESCHHAILSQMAAKYGFECRVINHYVENKKAIRKAIAEEVGITVEQAKTVITMTAYGARASEREVDAIPKEISVEKARILYKNPLYLALKDDIRKAFKVVLKHYPKERGRYVNAFRKTVPKEDEDKGESIIAHLLQGVEAAALRAATRACRDKLVLLQHDGFTTGERVSVSKIEAAVFEATGYELKFGEEQLVYPYAKLADELRAIDLKMRNQNKPIIIKDLGMNSDVYSSTMAIHVGRGVPHPSSALDWKYVVPIPPVYPEPIPETPDPFEVLGGYEHGANDTKLPARLLAKR